MNLLAKYLTIFSLFTLFTYAQTPKQKIHTLYIPLADHYAAIVAYERYASQMQYADFEIEQMKNWDLLRAYFQSGEVDMAFVMTPLAIDMYNENPHFKWIGLMHRDGNALAVNSILADKIKIEKDRLDRKPNKQIAEALYSASKKDAKAIQVGLPHLLSTHSVVLYKYLKDHGIKLTLYSHEKGDVLGIPIAPPKAPLFLKIKSAKAIPAAFEQSLPWADVVETEGFGKVIWYSKDIIPSKYGHVECIALATDKSIEKKHKALKEVQFYIHKAGADIEEAKISGGATMDEIVKMVRKHIPLHTSKAIRASLRADLNVVNYTHLNVDKEGLKVIMDYAVEGGILEKGLNIDAFADESFNIDLKAKNEN